MTVEAMNPIPELTDRQVLNFWAKVRITDDCWEWTRGKCTSGYGSTSVWPAGTFRAHRVSWTMAYGEIPDGMLLDHTCHNRACVRPDHLRLVNRKQNAENRLPVRGSASGVRGVAWDKSQNRWHARVGLHGKNIYVGSYLTIAEAEAAVIAKRLELYTHSDLDQRAVA